jgi:4-amino-4-deoxy-L-arabinose transferase-like glycosyltransferase
MKKTSTSSEPIFAFFIALAVIIFIRRDAFNLLFFWDELGLYVPYTFTFFRNGLHFTADYTFPPLAHPPLFFWMIAGLAKIIGWGIPAFRIMTFVAGAAYVSGTYMLARCRTRQLTSSLIALALLCAPVNLSEVALAQADLAAAAFSVWTLVALEKRKWKWATFLLALTSFANATFLVIVPAYALGFYLLQTKRTAVKDTLLFVLPAILVCALWFIYVLSLPSQSKVVTGSLLANMTFFRGFSFLFYRFAHRAYQIGFIDGRWILTLSIVAAVLWSKKKLKALDPTLWVFLAAIVLETIFLTFFGVSHQRYFMVILPMLYVWGGWSLVVLAEKAVPMGFLNWFTPRRLVRIILLLIAAYGFVMWHDHPNKYSQLEYRAYYQDQVRAMNQVADDLQKMKNGPVILTSWPLSHALQRPYLLYVKQPLNVLEFDHGYDGLDKNKVALKKYPGPKIAVFLNDGSPTKEDTFLYIEGLLKKKIRSNCKKTTRGLTIIEVCQFW